MTAKLERLRQQILEVFGGSISNAVLELGELTIEVASEQYFDVCNKLRDLPQFGFEQLIDLCGVDYSDYCDWGGKRFAVVSHLLSLANNVRLRVRVFASDSEFPVVASVCSVWNSANWFEREAFDLYGIHFEGHGDLRRILTDYGFIGHPFRKDFPISGYVEMRYDPEQKRVVYQPVTIEPREVIPRIRRESNYGSTSGGGARG